MEVVEVVRDVSAQLTNRATCGIAKDGRRAFALGSLSSGPAPRAVR
jgi:hypothetical protein